jgi:hypothetical protein
MRVVHHSQSDSVTPPRRTEERRLVHQIQLKTDSATLLLMLDPSKVTLFRIGWERTLRTMTNQKTNANRGSIGKYCQRILPFHRAISFTKYNSKI